jgi:hypothetical protein
MSDKKRETGPRILPAKAEADTMDEFSQDAAPNKPPYGSGNSKPVTDVDQNTRNSDGVNQSNKNSGDARKDSGAGPALARHSKDA